MEVQALWPAQCPLSDDQLELAIHLILPQDELTLEREGCHKGPVYSLAPNPLYLLQSVLQAQGRLMVTRHT